MVRRVLPLLVVSAFVLLAIIGGCRTASRQDEDSATLPSPRATIPNAFTPSPFATVPTVDANAAGRSDCPDAWLAYIDPQGRYSICYPADARVAAGEFALNVRSAAPASEERDGFTVTVAWSEGTTLALSADGAPVCQRPFVMGQTASSPTQMMVGGRTLPACLAHGVTEDGLPVGSLVGDLALAKDGSGRGGYLNLRLDFGGPGVPQIPELAQQILETLSVR